MVNLWTRCVKCSHSDAVDGVQPDIQGVHGLSIEGDDTVDYRQWRTFTFLLLTMTACSPYYLFLSRFLRVLFRLSSLCLT